MPSSWVSMSSLDEQMEGMVQRPARRTRGRTEPGDVATTTAGVAQTPTSAEPKMDMADLLRGSEIRRALIPEPFSGQPQDFLQFRRDFENMLVPYRLDTYLDAAIHDAEEPDMLVMPDRVADWDRGVYAILASLTRKAGTASLILDSIPDKNGWAAWRRWIREYQPQERDRQVSVYASWLSPEWSDDLDKWYPQWLQWESQWAKYSMETCKPIDDEARVATLLRWAPSRLQDFFKLSPDSITQSYKTLHDAVSAYVARSRVYPGGVTAPLKEPGEDSSQASQKTSAPASSLDEKTTVTAEATVNAVVGDDNVSAVSTGTKGKGKGRLLRQKDERIQELERQIEHLREQVARLTGSRDRRASSSAMGRQLPRFANLRPGDCYRCGQPGHRAFECDEELSVIEESLASLTLDGECGADVAAGGQCSEIGL